MSWLGVGPDWYSVEAPQGDPVMQPDLRNEVSFPLSTSPLPSQVLPTLLGFPAGHLFQASAHNSSPPEQSHYPQHLLDIPP